MRSKILVVALLMVCSGSAAAATITFDQAKNYTASCPAYTCFETEGFRFRDSQNWLESGGFLGMYPNDPVTMETLSGESFSVSSMNMYSTGHRITGYFADGGTVEINSAIGANWEVFTFDSSWQNLQKIEFEGYIGLDNIVVSTVPVPAAVWLFGSALAGMGWLGRRLRC